MKVGLPYDIEKVRAEWVGKRTETSRGRYPVEHDPIRRHCHMVDDDNPLFLDPEYAESTKYGGVIVPPVQVDYFAGNGAWPRASDNPTSGSLMGAVPTPGDRLINMSNEYEYLKPVKVGDRLSSYMEIADVFQKPIRLDPLATWIVTETHILNQNGEEVAIGRNTLLTHRAPEEVAANRDGTGAA